MFASSSTHSPTCRYSNSSKFTSAITSKSVASSSTSSTRLTSAAPAPPPDPPTTASSPRRRPTIHASPSSPLASTSNRFIHQSRCEAHPHSALVFHITVFPVAPERGPNPPVPGILYNHLSPTDSQPEGSRMNPATHRTAQHLAAALALLSLSLPFATAQ